MRGLFEHRVLDVQTNPERKRRVNSAFDVTLSSPVTNVPSSLTTILGLR